MRMTRRTAIAGALASMSAGTATAAANTTHADTLRTLIETVIGAGDVSTLETMVTPNITAPDYTISGIDAFRRASIAGHEHRQDTFIDYRFEIVTIVSGSEWAIAYVRLVGDTVAGPHQDSPVFYAARFDDGQVAELYF